MRGALLLAALHFAASASAQDWHAVERVEFSDAQRARSRAFDAVELTDGGNVHRLVLGPVDWQ